MSKITLLCFLIFLCFTGCTQPGGRIKIINVVPSQNTGQVYASWLNDDLNDLVPDCWNQSNFKYVDVTLQLEHTSRINRLSLYDYEGVFTDNPATLFALNGNTKTLIGAFTGEKYKEFVDIIPDSSITAEAIVIHKYCNNIPQKIFVFGVPLVDTLKALPRAVITFEPLANKKTSDSAFELIATSNNEKTPLAFASSNPAIVSVNNFDNKWMATILNAGTVTITALQAAGNNFLAATSMSQTIIIHPENSTTIINGKIPIDSNRWFQLTNASNGLEGLFDGDTSAEVTTGWGKILDNYDSYYPVNSGEEIDLAGVRMYDGAGSTQHQPMTLFIINTEGQKINIATFTGNQYNKWVGPDPENPFQFNLPTTFRNIKYLIINSWNFFPNEIELYGNYSPGIVAAPLIKKSFPLQNYFGINGFEWNFETPGDPGNVDAKSFKAAKTFTGLRHYLDWEKLESSKGSYSFNPTINGGWNYDALYDSCKAAGIDVLACIKTLPPWLLNTYPPDQRDAENVPVPFGSDFSNPVSYLAQAKVAFQFAARYGSNKDVGRSLLSIDNTPRWKGDNVNTIKVGLGTVNYIECDNERDKWWKGRKAYQTAYEYAANLSAFYDGNKNTMGPGVGVKNADSNMKVVMAGTASPSTEYLKGMIDWCRRNRGYKADGTINLCWDVINYHFYSNDSKTSQNDKATRGTAPEISGAADAATKFIEVAHEDARDMPVWITEAGYDINQGSPFKAVPLKNKPALETQADWMLRTALLYARSGIGRLFFYEMYDDNIANPQQFSSSGLINNNKTRKPAADFIYQVNKLFGRYVYRQTIDNYPAVDRYQFNNNNMYVVFVPGEKGSNVNYTLNLRGASFAEIFTPTGGSDDMDKKTVATINGNLPVTATETPQFIIPVSIEKANPDFTINSKAGRKK